MRTIFKGIKQVSSSEGDCDVASSWIDEDLCACSKDCFTNCFPSSLYKREPNACQQQPFKDRECICKCKCQAVRGCLGAVISLGSSVRRQFSRGPG